MVTCHSPSSVSPRGQQTHRSASFGSGRALQHLSEHICDLIACLHPCMPGRLIRSPARARLVRYHRFQPETDIVSAPDKSISACRIILLHFQRPRFYPQPLGWTELPPGRIQDRCCTGHQKGLDKQTFYSLTCLNPFPSITMQ